MNEFQSHIYPVGLLRDMKDLHNAVRLIVGHPRNDLYRAYRIRSLRYMLRRMIRDTRRRSYWNGYLAEPTTENIYWTRCGHGWTKRRAMASLTRHIGEVQRDGYLRMGTEVAS